ncbi:tRNA (5-methylaminomethyl-2-thiouridine)(34)-methyltransferase MnmD [Flavobacterium cheniae]|uniref:tRNA U34 5-methylaminomethyl-2-thiouridine-forming methyltransferase MnmC n=1 Tax=Flavobacterium cheniae TaxID=295428 RepID=A0A562KJW6_9FLAO|nr:tRNA (5-methylaminomethyl-2-thiouridine)(34)-methyltransferase MnmD [Flavobacterium cheniae]TDR25959.1 tRNA U34 5-methylaminomethyl-2-thiouridine-forming methyltransferase MnmC [Flavobacterium cheniae]TWH95565.1 tRNA U34 5-methylaminomethyl-2-thiouridine-forming methyltransferase MnmC [Flavobacterium cheniae]
MKREIIITDDGSTTIRIPEWDENYHSTHGAIQEAKHVFIKNGLDLFQNQDAISILEIGFGTGLNAFITFLETINKEKVNYVGVEAYPISQEEIAQMNYVSELDSEMYQEIFDKMHSCDWEKQETISENFHLTKRKQFFQDIEDKNQFDLIYFDAFGFPLQPELWSEAIFKKMYDALLPKRTLVTYACRSSIKNAMLSVGFSIEKLPGAPGKREMLRATKNV